MVCVAEVSPDVSARDGELLRLFAAILLTDEVRAALARLQRQLAATCDGVRWVREEGLHLTVKFLGEVDDGEISRVGAALGRGTAQGTPFSITIEGAGCFPPGGGVRIVWAGVSDASGVMTRGVASIRSALDQLGFAPDRRAWSPHVTIGRIKYGGSGGRIRSEVDRITYPAVKQFVESVSLMASELSPTGPTYTKVLTCSLG